LLVTIARLRPALGICAALLALGAFGASPALAAPENDDFANAASITSGTPFPVTNVAGGGETGEPHDGSPAVNSSVWFKYTSPGPGYIDFNTCTTSIDTVASAYTGTAVNALSLATAGSYADGGCASGAGSKIPTFPVASGTQIFFSVRNYFSGDEGNFTAALTFTPYVPANDPWAGATDLGTSVAEELTDDNTYATVDNLAPLIDVSSGNHGNHSVWYKWTSPIDGNVLWDACASIDRDTVLGAFSTSASVPSLALMSLVKADDDGCGHIGGPSQLVLPVQAGTTYWIELAGYDNSSFSYGSYLLKLSLAFANQVLPVIDAGATNKVGDTLHVDNGTWIGSAPTFEYSWQRCNVGLVACAPIEGAVGAAYKLTSADIGKVVNARVRASSSVSIINVTSNHTDVILDADSDGDGVLDQADACPATSGTQANGCPPAAPTKRVLPFSLPKSFPTSKVTKKGAIAIDKFNFTCPADATAKCSVEVTVSSTGKRTAKLAANLVGVNLSSRLKSIPLKLNSAGKKLLRKSKQIKASVTVKITAPGYEPFEDKKPVKVGGNTTVANPLYDIKVKF
jgi:hypothetical protein